MKIHQLTRHLYRYVCSNSTVPSNGLIYVNSKEALLVDAPRGDGITDSLLNWMQQKGLKVTAAIITHWHMQDRMGGLQSLQSRGIKTYSSKLTAALATANKLLAPEFTFTDSATLHIGRGIVLCSFLGAGHTKDNAVVWFEDDKVLFGGCLIKDITSTTLGYVQDADVNAWPHTVRKVIGRFPNARIVVPGHFNFGDKGLLTHTLELAQHAGK